MLGLKLNHVSKRGHMYQPIISRLWFDLNGLDTLLKRFNFDPSMDKYLHTRQRVGWNYLRWNYSYIPKLQQCCRPGWEMEKNFHLILGVWTYSCWVWTLRWRHNGHDSVSNHQSRDCFLSRYLDAGQRKQQSSVSLAFVRWIHRRPVNSPHKWPVTRKMFPFDDVIMKSIWIRKRVPR